ncbi:MAG TPA: KH domain-containing protein [Bacteroidetes bacterium]|nr:KH domain-containing protein [Bacteroidota bacterium]
MKEFVEFMAKHLVDDPESVEVTEIAGERTSVYELRVPRDQLGRVIGHRGSIAKAMRVLLAAACAKQGKKRAVLEILEKKES